MDALQKFLRVKRKSEYLTDKGKIKISKKDKRKIKRFKENKSVGTFIVERPNITVFVCETRESPIAHTVKAEETEESLRRESKAQRIFLEKQKRKRENREKHKKVEDVEDLWSGRGEKSDKLDRKLSRKTEKPREDEVYDSNTLDLRSTREQIWKSIHFYRDTVRRPRVYESELSNLYSKLAPVKVKVPADTEVPIREYTEVGYKENIRSIISMSSSIYHIVVHSSSISIRDSAGYLPIRTVRLTNSGEDVLIRCAYLSPDEKKLAVITFGCGIFMMSTEMLLEIGSSNSSSVRNNISNSVSNSVSNSNSVNDELKSNNDELKSSNSNIVSNNDELKSNNQLTTNSNQLNNLNSTADNLRCNSTEQLENNLNLFNSCSNLHKNSIELDTSCSNQLNNSDNLHKDTDNLHNKTNTENTNNLNSTTNNLHNSCPTPLELIIDLNNLPENNGDSNSNYRIFNDSTFRKGAWHPKSIYFSAILHGKVVIVNTKKSKAVVFYNGSQNIQHVEFHRTKSIIIMLGPSNIFFYGLSTKRKDSKKTIYHISAGNTMSLSLNTETLFIGSACSIVQIFRISKSFESSFIRAIYTRNTPKRIVLHERYGYAAVFDGSPTFLVYGNGLRTDLLPAERAGAIHKYEHSYKTGLFHGVYPKGVFGIANRVTVLFPEYNLDKK